MKVIVIGSINKDYVYSVKNIVRQGETATSYDYKCFWGGKGFNQTVALSKAGAKPVFLCKASNSDYEEIVKVFNLYGIGTESIQKGGSVTGHAIIQVDENGQNSILLHPGANHEVTKSEIDGILSKYGKGDILLLQNEISNVDYAIEKAHARGIITAFNPSPISATMTNMELIDIFILNEVECAELTGINDSYDKMAEAMRRKFQNAEIVLTVGKDGVIFINKDKKIRQPAGKVNSVDTTAAGDTFTGFFISEYSKGIPIEAALKTASKAAAIAVTRAGAANSIPSMTEVEGFAIC